MSTASAPDPFQFLADQIAPGARLLRTWPLTGGISAEVTVLELEQPDGQTSKLIVRRHGPIDLAHNPHIARDEYRLLELVRAHGISAPLPHLFDESGSLLPSPFIVIDYTEGETDFAPADLPDFLQQLAAQLARIHSIAASPDLAFLPSSGPGYGPRPAILDDSMREVAIRAALEAAAPLPALNPSVLLHGDFWPGNLIWQSGQLAAVIDWEDARIGDPLVDLGNTRLELLWALGPAAMQAFTANYTALMPALDLTHLPYWDLSAALQPCGRLAGWGLAAADEHRMRTLHDHFVTGALHRLTPS